jgi:hypothetical protein
VPHSIDGSKGLSLRGEHLLQGFPKILQQMEAVRDLGRLGRALPSAFRIGTRPVARDDLHPGSRTRGLRIMFRDLSRLVCTVPISRLSALETCFQPLVPAS